MSYGSYSTNNAAAYGSNFPAANTNRYRSAGGTYGSAITSPLLGRYGYGTQAQTAQTQTQTPAPRYGYGGGGAQTAANYGSPTQPLVQAQQQPLQNATTITTQPRSDMGRRLALAAECQTVPHEDLRRILRAIAPSNALAFDRHSSRAELCDELERVGDRLTAVEVRNALARAELEGALASATQNAIVHYFGREFFKSIAPASSFSAALQLQPGDRKEKERHRQERDREEDHHHRQSHSRRVSRQELVDDILSQGDSRDFLLVLEKFLQGGFVSTREILTLRALLKEQRQQKEHTTTAYRRSHHHRRDRRSRSSDRSSSSSSRHSDSDSDSDADRRHRRHHHHHQMKRASGHARYRLS
jgi:hypothetical protein